MSRRTPRFSIFFITVLIIMGLGLLFTSLNEDDEDAGTGKGDTNSSQSIEGSELKGGE